MTIKSDLAIENSSPRFAQRLHALVRLIRRPRQRWLPGIRLIGRFPRCRWLLGVRLIWRLRQRWLLGALRVRCCSWIGQRRFERFVCLGSRSVEHMCLPGIDRGERAAIIRCLVARHNFQPRFLNLLQRWCALWRMARCSKLLGFEHNFSYASGLRRNLSKALARRQV